jgi:hypothetical protein
MVALAGVLSVRIMEEEFQEHSVVLEMVTNDISGQQ